MKKTITILSLLIILTSCQEPEKTDGAIIAVGAGLANLSTAKTASTFETIPDPVIEPEPPIIDPIIEPEPEPEKLEILFTIANGENLFYYDGVNLTAAHVGSFYVVDNETIVKEDILYKIDAFGDTVSSIQLPVICDFMEESGTDFYCIRIVPKSEAIAYGAGNYNYAEIWKNYTKINDWWENKWLVQELIKTESGDIVAKTSTGAYHPISGNQANIQLAGDDGLFIYNYDPIARTALIKTSGGIKSISWATNYMNDASDWISTSTLYLSNNGYSYNHDTGLQENDTILMNFRSYPYPIAEIESNQPPTVIAAGVRYENSEDVTYWIECNTGYVVRYVRSIDAITTPFRLYTGNGTQAVGVGYSGQLKPIIFGDDLYYNFSGSIWKVNLDTKVFTAVIGQNAKFYSMR